MIDDKILLTRAGLDISDFSEDAVRCKALTLRNLIGGWMWLADLDSQGRFNTVRLAMKVATVEVEQERIGLQMVEVDGDSRLKMRQTVTIIRRRTDTVSSETGLI